MGRFQFLGMLKQHIAQMEGLEEKQEAILEAEYLVVVVKLKSLQDVFQ